MSEQNARPAEPNDGASRGFSGAADGRSSANTSLSRPKKSKPRIAFDVIRRSLAGLILLYGIVAIVPNSVIPPSELCSTTSKTVTGPGAQRTVEESRTCNGPGVERLTPFVLLAIIFILPDVAEVGVPGLLTLKRRVDQQEERIERSEIRQTQLMQTLNQAVSNVQTNVAVSIPDVLYRLAADRGETDLDRISSSRDGMSEGHAIVATDERVDTALRDLSSAKRDADRAASLTSRTEEDVKLLAWEAQYKEEITVLLEELVKVQQAPQSYSQQYKAAVAEAAKQALAILAR